MTKYLGNLGFPHNDNTIHVFRQFHGLEKWLLHLNMTLEIPNPLLNHVQQSVSLGASSRRKEMRFRADMLTAHSHMVGSKMHAITDL